MNLLTVVGLGFVLGMRHATDPDHVIAVTTIVSREREADHAAYTGIAWGIGHTLTILAVGAPIIFLNLVIPARVGLAMELMVALMLVLLGLANQAALVRRFLGTADAGQADGIVHTHAHSHGDYVHEHPHAHAPERHPHGPEDTPLARLDRRLGPHALYQLTRPLVVGLVHGLAGSAAATLLVLAIIPDPVWALGYLVLFGVGTIAGMMLITISLAATFRYAAQKHAGLTTQLKFASGLLSLVFGLLLAYQICVADGLFGNPVWVPH
jgi:high-affinity nickel-transport protein